MKCKKSFIFICLIVCLFSIASISAGDANDTVIASENQNLIEIENQDSVDANVVTAEVDNENQNIESNVISSSNEDILNAQDNGTFTALQNKIYNVAPFSTVYLENNYNYDEGFNTDGITISKPLTIDGNGYTIDGDNTARIFTVTNNNVVFKNIIFINGKTTGEGGAINGNCAAINCTFRSNNANHGGAVYGDSSSAVNCTFNSNSADDEGGAMYGGSAVNCTFNSNSANCYGGAMFDGSAVNCTFIGNSALWTGGAMFGGSAVNCTFISNSANDGSGGAMYYVSAVNCTFISNSANDGSGGAMYGGSAVNCTFIGNSADSYGGAMYGGSAVNCTFDSNFANYGGAMYGGSAVNCTFINNNANEYGGAMYNDGNKVTDCQFINNTAKNGGATYKTTAINCNFTINTATEYGGAMYEGTADCCIFNGNNAGIDGDDTYNTIFPKAILSVPDFNSIYGSGDKLLFTLTSSSGKKINNANITIRIYKDTLIGTYYALSGEGWVVELDAGSYIAECIIENQGYNVDPVFPTLNISKADSTLTVNNMEFDYGTSGTTNVSYTGAIGVTAEVLNQPSAVVSVEGNVITVSGLNAGNYILNVTTVSDGNHKVVSNTTTIAVNKIDSDISAYYDRKTKEIVATVTNVNTGKGLITVNVLVNVDGVDYALKTDSKGQFRLSVNNLTPGIYAASIVYNGNSKYNPSNATITVNIKSDTCISAYYDQDTKEIVATVTNVYTGKGLITVNVFVNINNVDYALKTNSKGEVKVSIVDLAPGIYTASVSYNGSNKYKPSYTTAVVNNKLDTSISAFYDAESRELIAAVTNDNGKGLITVNVLVSLNGVDYALKTDSKGQVKLSTANLDIGDYTAFISYNGNNKYNPVTATANFIVNKADTNIVAFYDVESKELVATVSNAVSGKGLITVNVLVSLNGVDYALKTDSKGQIKLSIADLAPGIYTASVSYKGNNKYYSSNTTVVLNTKSNTTISAVYNRESSELVATVTNVDSGKGLVTVNVLVNFNGVDYALKTDSKGQIKLSTVNLTPGTYVASISYNGNNKYNPSSTKIFVINKLNTSISVFFDAESKELVTTLTKDNGKVISNVNVLVSLNGVDYALRTDSNGQVKVSTANLDLGNYTAVISYNGNSKYYPATVVANFIVNKVDTSIVAFYDAESKELVANVSNAVSGKGLITVNLLVSLNGVDYSLKTDSKGQVKVSTANLDLGNYTAVISYNGNNKYYPVTVAANFIVNKVDSNIVAFYDVESKELVATVSNAVSGKGLITVNVLVNIDGVDYALKTDSKGKVKFSTVDLDLGTYIASVYYNGNSKYYASNATVVVINKADTCISAFYDGESKELVATVSNAVSGEGLATVNVLVSLNGLDYALMTDSNGQVRVSCENLTPGNYYAVIYYNGDSRYYPVNATFDVVIEKDYPQLSANDVSITYGEEAYLVATLKDSKGNGIGYVDINVNLNDETYTLTTDYNGNVRLSISSLTPNVYTAVFNFAGNDLYYNVSATATVNVDKLRTMLTSSSVTATYGSDSYLIGTLTASSTGAVGSYSPVKGATVVITIGNQEYSLTTDSYGQVKFNTKNLLPGTYSAQMIYYGDTIHRLTVGQDIDTYGDSTITINRANPTITASGVTTTYGTEGFVTATLKDNNGNVMADRLVTFTFADGTGNTVRTDRYGKAQLSTSGYDAGTYNLNVKFAPEYGTDDYNKYNTVSATATMKINKLDGAILYARYAPNQYGYGEWIVNKQGQKVNNFNEYSGEHKDIYIYAEDSNGNPIVGATVINKAENVRATTNSNGAAIFDMYWPMLGSPYERDIQFVLDSPNYNAATVTVHLYVVRRS